MRKFIILVLVVLLLATLSTFAFAKTTFKLAHVYNPEHPWDKGAHMAADIVKEKTGGEIEIIVFPASQLGTEEQITEAVIFGSIDMCVSGAGQIGNLFKPIYVAEMPYTFSSLQHVLRFAKSDIGQKMFDDLEKEFNVKAIGVSAWGVRHLIGNKVVRTPEDLKGFKLRVPEQQVCVEYGRAMGSNPTPIAYSEAYMALQQGVVDGLENSLSAFQNMKFYEVAKNISLTAHVTNCCFYLMNGDKFNGLTKENQEIILDAFNQASEYIVELLEEDDKNLVQFFEDNGCTVVEPDIEAFKEKTASMPEKFKKWWIRYGGDLHSRIQDL